MLSNPEDRKRLYNAVKELDKSMTHVEAERDFQKQAIDAAAEELNLEKKYIRKLAAIYHKQNMNAVKQEQEEIEALYEIMSGEISKG